MKQAIELSVIWDHYDAQVTLLSCNQYIGKTLIVYDSSVNDKMSVTVVRDKRVWRVRVPWLLQFYNPAAHTRNTVVNNSQLETPLAKQHYMMYTLSFFNTRRLMCNLGFRYSQLWIW